MNRRGFFTALAGAVPARDLHEVEAASVGMDRRGFLKLLGASTAITTAALVVGLDVDRLLWIPEKTIVLPPAGGWPALNPKQFDRNTYERARFVPLNLKALTHEMVHQVAARRARRGEKAATLVPGYGHRVGDTFRLREEASFDVRRSFQPVTFNYKTVALIEQAACDLPMSPQFSATAQREGVPIEMIAAQAAALEHHMHERGMNVFAELDLPHSVDQACVVLDEKSGIALRGVRFYDIATDQYRLRFDVLGGKA